MAFLQVQFFSEALTVASTVNVIMPEHSQGIGVNASGEQVKELPKVLYLLHGYSDDHSIWMRRTSVERYAAAHNLAVIMPAVNHSFYSNEIHGERYWDYVAYELPTAMHRFFKLSEKPEDTFVAGLSMGGYGAMKLALTFPERYAAAGSFSGALDYAHAGIDSHVLDFSMHHIFGEESPVGTDADLFHLLEKNAGAPKKPRLYVSCGTEDFIYDHTTEFVPAAREAGWDVTCYEKPGAIHEWGFWDEEIAKFIPWMLNA